MQSDELEYVGFWPRVGASLIDTILLGVIIWPILTAFYGESYWTSGSFVQGPMDFLLSWIFPAVAVILFWVAKQATPGKMAVSAKIVDAKTGNAASTGQLIGRYFAYYLSLIPLGLGFIWIAFDERKQGWHDKLAGTVVVRKKNREPKSVTFSG
ncbi:RDD family protein [Thalassomonas sp. RHCl1]|uniref:RDD family protein n=1 Tax=Thalassomonas sp. RHCl1 TaxID=2995320 RepID=UPI00248D1293|nr:RDD family protein [Thalassomonas sp. RHCl1]